LLSLGPEAAIRRPDYVVQAPPLLRVLQDRRGHRVPSGDILRNKEANSHIIKWAIELSNYSIEFRSRPTIKSQALADFIAEWTEIQEPIAATCPEHWVMYFDVTLNINGAGAGILFITPTKDKL